MARKNSVEITVSLKDAVTKGMSSVQRSLTSLKKNVLSVKTAIAGVGLGLLAGSAVETASSFEQIETKLDALTKGKGKETLDELNQWALDMPVNTQKAVDAFSLMQAMGLEPTIEKMETLVDTSTVFGEETMPVVARALGQMQTLGKLSAEELNQLAEAGINARKYLTEAFGMTVEEIQNSQIAIEDIVQAIWDGLDRDFGGAAANAQTKWKAMTATASSYWTEFQRLVMDSGLFKYMEAGFKTILDKVQELHKNGQLKDWANSVSDSIISTFESALLGVAGFVDAIQPMVKQVSSVGGKIYDGFKAMPAWVQEVGVVGAMLGGKKGVLVLAALSSASKELEVQSAGLAAARAGLIAWKDLIFSTNTELEKLLKKRGIWEQSSALAEAGGTDPRGPAVQPGANGRYKVPEDTSGDDPSEGVDPESATHAAQAWIAKFRAAFSAAGDSVKETVASTMTKVTTSAKDVVGKASLSSMAKAELTRFQAQQKTMAVELDKALDDHLVSVKDYYDKKKAMAQSASQAEIDAVTSRYGSEIAGLKSQIANENDLATVKKLKDSLAEKELSLSTEVYTKEQALVRELLSLENQRADAVQNNTDAKAGILQGISDRVEPEDDQADGFDQELAALKEKHAAEYQELVDFGATKAELAQASALQQQELDQVTADNAKALMEKRMTYATDFSSNMASVFKNLAEAGIGNSKAMFAAYKAFAITNTLIQTYSAAMASYNAMASIPYVGPFLGAAAAAAAVAAGVAKVAAIRAETVSGYAFGGLIDGPDQGSRADNVTIKATPGEYMMDRPTVAHYGVQAMEALRQHTVPREAFAGVSLPAAKPAYSKAGFATGGQVGANAGTGGGTTQQTTIVNVTDRSELDRYMASTEGQSAILNVISAKNRTVRRMVSK